MLGIFWDPETLATSVQCGNEMEELGMVVKLICDELQRDVCPNSCHYVKEARESSIMTVAHVSVTVSKQVSQSEDRKGTRCRTWLFAITCTVPPVVYPLMSESSRVS